jgi:hypothetical protein
MPGDEPQRVESELLVVSAFRAGDDEYRIGDHAPVKRREVRQAALSNPDRFRTIWTTTDLDLDWLRGIDQEIERKVRAIQKQRKEGPARARRAPAVIYGRGSGRAPM